MGHFACKLSVLAFIATIILTGCTKTNSTVETVTTADDMAILTNLAIVSMDEQEVYSDNPDLGIYMLDEGIASCFLADATDLTGNDSLRSRIRHHALIACLRSLTLTETQLPLVKEDLRKYNVCNQNAISRARTLYHELQASYRIKYHRISQAYQSGAITATEFRAQVSELRTTFKRELRSMHLREKLDDAFKRCFRLLLADLYSTLTDRQWNAFKECFRGQTFASIPVSAPMDRKGSSSI